MQYLPQAAIDYAIQDTRYLVPLAQQLQVRLEALGRWTLYRELEAFSLAHMMPPGTDPLGALHVPASRSMFKLVPKSFTSRQLKLLEALMMWRETCAFQADCPPYKICSNAFLLHLVTVHTPFARPPTRWPRNIAHAEEEHLALCRASYSWTELDLQLDFLLPDVRPTSHLRRFRNDLAKELGFRPEIIIPPELLHDLEAEGDPTLHSLETAFKPLPVLWGMLHTRLASFVEQEAAKPKKKAGNS